MLIKQKHLEGIKAGSISLAFRKWKKLQVNAGSLVKTSVGVIRIVSTGKTDLDKITDADAQKAGFAAAQPLVQLLESQKDGEIYKIEVVFDSESPRIELREEVAIDEEELEALKIALENLDKFSKVGKWTTKTLIAIQENPKLRAADLAIKAKKEKEWLKLNIRKLKALGLTISHEPGYTLSPLGEEYLKLISK
ncbi:ASCH domain-containing protein [Dyadobacter frigoris]|uniref:ASCH domain-containing protein n=1 Tax=Dyadobacter frigoris TaxID=2576211 RepID=A0A4U6CQ27_9BACT|nr:ASCH domain-containing protein [Dyadobacter frigoris]TKT86589.1 ASCH domain-containing protein [Dyadobacter frigoris]GLU56868.1 hypothetical protein Dfri01_63290 [Dyadobacter frigoris]